MKHQEKLNLLKDFLIPEIFFETRNVFSRLIEKSIYHPESLIEESVLIEGYFGVKDYQSENFATISLLDSLTEGFIRPFRELDVEDLWGVLSSILNSQNIEFLRPLLTKEIYENSSINYNFYNCSKIFKSTDFIVIKINFMEFEALTLVNKHEMNDICSLCEDLRIEVNEMNKNHH
ncbi:hypothetical protein [Empedobacter sp. UBA7248]|uniref:hypothetical protein n=1 Tax=Empedobacter sp. UBA7248 TaxID=1946448 RepID=UPI0025C041A5|nr:hypothetical protein [Empedobacter sp. UBA7248]